MPRTPAQARPVKKAKSAKVRDRIIESLKRFTPKTNKTLPVKKTLKKDSKPFPFLALAPELRNSVYGFYFTLGKAAPFDEDYKDSEKLPVHRARLELPETEYQATQYGTKLKTDFEPQVIVMKNYPDRNLPLLKTCRQIHQEAKLFLWSRTNFDFSMYFEEWLIDGANQVTFIRHPAVQRFFTFLKTLKPAFAQNLKYLTMDQGFLHGALSFAVSADWWCKKEKKSISLKHLTILAHTYRNKEYARLIEPVRFKEFLAVAAKLTNVESFQFRMYPGFCPHPRLYPHPHFMWYGQDYFTQNANEEDLKRWMTFLNHIINMARPSLTSGKPRVEAAIGFTKMYRSGDIRWTRCLVVDYLKDQSSFDAKAWFATPEAQHIPVPS